MGSFKSSNPADNARFPAASNKTVKAYFNNGEDDLWDPGSYALLRYSNGTTDLLGEDETYNYKGWNNEEYTFFINFNPNKHIGYPIALVKFYARKSTDIAAYDFFESRWIRYYPYTLCEAPTNVRVSNSSSISVGPSTNVTLSWQAPTAGKNNPIAGYNVYRATTASGSYTKINSSLITGTTYTVTSPASSGSYYYKVTAYNKYGETDAAKETSRSSSYATLTTTYESPTAPRDLTISETQAKKGSTIRLSWTAPESAGTHNTLAGYKVYFKDGAGSYDYSKSTAADTRTTTHAVSNESGVTRYFYVTAYGSIDGTESPASNVVSVVTKGGTIKYHNGTGWVECEVYYHNGSQWVECEVKYHDGSSWRDVSS